MLELDPDDKRALLTELQDDDLRAAVQQFIDDAGKGPSQFAQQGLKAFREADDDIVLQLLGALMVSCCDDAPRHVMQETARSALSWLALSHARKTLKPKGQLQ